MAEPMIGGDPTSSPSAQKRAAGMVGRVVSDRYRIVELVAMGGMGAIFRAEHLHMHKHVAIKVLHPEIEGFPELVARFEREAVAGAHIQHPNVAAASDFGKFDGESCFLVLEYIEGATLRDLLKKGPLSAERAASIARQLALALSAVHDKGIVHRDLKPLNVMVLKSAKEDPTATGPARPDGDVVKLIDFGLAKVPVDQLSLRARDADSLRRSLTAAGVVMGTVAYIAPESALGMRSVGPRADLYSLGVVFYEMLAGKHPFDGEDAKTLFSQHRSSIPEPISKRNPAVTVPRALEMVVMRLLSKDPDARYPGADDVVRAIDAALAPAPAPSLTRHELTPISLSKSESPASTSPGAKRAWMWLAGGIAAAGVVSLIVSFTLRPSEPAAQPSAAPSESSHADASKGSAESAPRPEPPVAKTARDKLRAAIESKDSRTAASVLIELIDSDAKAFKDRAVQTDAAEAAAIAAEVDTPKTDEVFNAIATKLGSEGLDVLYDIVARDAPGSDQAQRVGLTRPKSAAARARTLLARGDLITNATPAMRIALDLMRQPCSTRPTLFPRAGKEGDDRALQILTSMQPPACTPNTPCCFPQHRLLDRTISDIQARLRR
ncbi:MAG: serine/threonine protein kinase [Polyangiaceae bacterium]|nr:serine/threonine protein kinase [Polyangiaceae bacterium]